MTEQELPTTLVVMIGSITGTVRDVGIAGLLLEVGGVGYHVSVLPTFLAGAKVGQSLTLRTHLHVREDELSLYGFATKEELGFFQLLLGVPGVGPKSALAILTLVPVWTLVRAVTSGDANLLTKVSGIGRKTAERIIVELKTRLEREYPALAERGVVPHADVVEALMVLGYSLAQVREAVRQLPPDVQSVEDGVKAALQLLGQRAHARR